MSKLKEYRPMMERCSNCLGCKWIPFDKIKSQRFGENCPSVCYFNYNTYSARGRFQLAQTILDNDAQYTDTITEAVFSCLSCGACDVSCKICRYNLEPLEHNIALKSDAIENGKTLHEQNCLILSLSNEKTMIDGMKKVDRNKWIRGLKVKDALSDKAEVLFIAGCKYSYDEKLEGKAKDMLEILIKVGVDVGILENADMCCGGRAHQMGYISEFEDFANKNIDAIKKTGAKVIVTPCSDCYHTYKRLYAALGLDIEVLHIIEYLEELINEGKIKFSKTLDMTVTYHDPCHLGRLGEPYIEWNGKEKKIRNQIHTWDPKRPRYNGAHGIYDAPRNVLAAIPGVKLVEMERIREYSWCCGAGGGCSEIAKDFSAWTAGERILEANSTGAEVLITACPWCESNLSGVADENGKTLPVMDIIDIVLKAI